MRLTRPLAICTLAACLVGSPGFAGAGGSPEPGLSERLDQALREMLEQMKPALDDLLDAVRIFEEIDGLENYRRPEILPNGDIIIRRREDAPAWPPDDRAPPEETDLRDNLPDPDVRT